MVNRIGPTPQLSQPTGNNPEDIRALARSFFIDSTDLRARLREMLPKDGTEGMNAPLPLQIVATGDLPSAADWEGAIIYDTTLNLFLFSNGTTWQTGTGSLINPFYSAGTFTPVLAFGGTTTGITYSVQTGDYIKIGNLVQIIINITLTSNGTGTGTATVSGLPFAAVANTELNFSVAIGAGLLAACQGFVGAGTTIFNPRQSNALLGTAVLTETNLTDSALFRIAGTYITS